MASRRVWVDWNKWAGPLSPLDFGSSRACKRRWAPYVRDHDPGQGQLPVSTIKAPGHRIPDARSRTRPSVNLGVPRAVRNGPAAEAMQFRNLAVVIAQQLKHGDLPLVKLVCPTGPGVSDRIKGLAHTRNRFVDSEFKPESESAVLMKRKE